jgi:hypothetical protein
LGIEKTDAAGSFSFALPDYSDGMQFDLQVKGAGTQKQEYKIIVDPVAFPRFETPAILKNISVNLSDSTNKGAIHQIDSILSNARFISLQPITITATDPKQNAKGKKSNSGIITQEMLQAGGVNNAGQAVLRSGKFHLLSNYLIAGGSNGFAPAASDEPIVVMDGIQQSIASDMQEMSPVLSYLKTIPTNEIEYIRLLTGSEGTAYGVRGGHGVIEIHSANKLHTTTTETKNAVTIAPKGFYIPAAFSMPDYANKEIRRSKTPDLRTTIYWNGDIITDNQGKTQVTFYTADLPATYIIKVGGVTVNGDKLLQTATIKTE